MLPDEDIYSNFDLTYAKIMKHRDLELFQSKIGSHEIRSQIIPNLHLKSKQQHQHENQPNDKSLRIFITNIV